LYTPFIGLPIAAPLLSQCLQLSLKLGSLLPDASPRNAPLILLAATPLPKQVLARLIPALAHIPIVPIDDELPPDDASFTGLRWTTALAASAM
jgi:hypothetical protein